MHTAVKNKPGSNRLAVEFWQFIFRKIIYIGLAFATHTLISRHI